MYERPDVVESLEEGRPAALKKKHMNSTQNPSVFAYTDSSEDPDENRRSIHKELSRDDTRDEREQD